MCYNEKVPNAWHSAPRYIKDRELLRTQSTQMTADRHNSQTKHHRQGSRITPTSTAPVNASSRATPRHYYANAAGSLPDSLSHRSPMRSTGGTSRTTTQTPPAPAGTCGPSPGGPKIRRNRWTAKEARPASEEKGGRGRDEGGGGRARARD